MGSRTCIIAISTRAELNPVEDATDGVNERWTGQELTFPCVPCLVGVGASLADVLVELLGCFLSDADAFRMIPVVVSGSQVTMRGS